MVMPKCHRKSKRHRKTSRSLTNEHDPDEVSIEPTLNFRLTAVFDSCHSQTALDLPFIYDCYGNIKKQKVGGFELNQR